MATAFYGQMTIEHPDGTVECDRFDSTDVNNIYVTWKSNGGNTFYTVRKSGFIKDIVLNIVTAGTTKYIKLYINQTDPNISFIQSNCFPTLNVHWPNLTPIPVLAGQQILLQTVT